MAETVVVSTLLGLCAIAEAVARTADTGASVQRTLVLCLVALATTLPPALMSQQPAAVTVVVASVVSLTSFHTLTVASLVAAVLALYRAGRAARPETVTQLVAVGLAFAFLVLALIHPVPPGSEAGARRALGLPGARGDAWRSRTPCAP